MASSIVEILAAMRNNPLGVRFADACKVADHFFGAPTQNKSSHRVWKMPWPGNPRVNMQNEKGYAKAYQVRQLLEAVARRLGQLRAGTGAEVAPMSHAATATEDKRKKIRKK